jgi:hypothetical protein
MRASLPHTASEREIRCEETIGDRPYTLVIVDTSSGAVSVNIRSRP